jgi:hypothetical protein
MLLQRCLIAATLCVAAGLLSPAADTPVPAGGKYVLTLASGAGYENRIAIVKLSEKDGQYTAEVVATPPASKALPGQPARQPQKVTIGEPKVVGGLITFTVEVGAAKYEFEGRLDSAHPTLILGSLEARGYNYRAALTATEKVEFAEGEGLAQTKLPDELQQANKLRAEPFLLQNRLRQEKDEEKKKELSERVKAAKKEADEKIPGLLVKVVETNSDSAVGYHTLLELLSVLGKTKATPAEVKKWADGTVAYAAKHGPRFEKTAVAAVAVALATQSGLGEVALPFAERYAAGADKSPTAQVKALSTLAAAQGLAGKLDAEKATRAKIAILDADLDAEYRTTTPGFAVEKYPGRKNPDANRVAVLELFTGAQCPPCVAADIAFDALEKTYSTKDVVFVQYHMHIPGPDPLTNSDTIARWDYYSKLHPEGMRGVPSSLFNGKPQAGGGGGRDAAKGKYEAYTKAIDAILEQKTNVKIDGLAVLADGSVTATASVAGVEKADGKVVRLLLVEDEVKYVGGNGIRFHHSVVRSAFGNAAGWTGKDGKVSAAVKLADLRKGLSEYLENYNKNERAFNPPDRPLDLKHLKVIVLVQDDETSEILNALQLEVKEGKP